jgi:hypothetical protein
MRETSDKSKKTRTEAKDSSQDGPMKTSVGTNCEAVKRFAQQDWLVNRRLMRSSPRLRH